MYSSFDIPPDFTGPCTRRRYDGTKLYNTYYQWVSIFLGTLSILFYIPRCIWMVLEGNLMAYIVKGNLLMAWNIFISLKLKLLSILSYHSWFIFIFVLGTESTIRGEISDKDEKIARTIEHFKKYIHNRFNRYAFGFFFCELLNLILAFVGFWMTHRFLNDEFLTYGFDVYRYIRKLF